MAPTRGSATIALARTFHNGPVGEGEPLGDRRMRQRRGTRPVLKTVFTFLLLLRQVAMLKIALKQC